MQTWSLIAVFVIAHLSVYLCTANGRQLSCDPGPLVEKHEGRKQCVYLDTKKIKTIGVGYNMQNKDAPEVFRSIGADYEKFYNGPTTPWNAKCNCSAVPCLTNEQIDQLFSLSLKTAISDAQAVVPNFPTLCCPVQNVMVDMAFTFGRTRFAGFTVFTKIIQIQNWKAAGDDLTLSKWCVNDAPKRCSEDASIVANGCGCTDPFPQACNAQASACCASKSESTCCKETVTFHSFITKSFEEMMCCPLPNATCCPANKCCPDGFPVCCPDSNFCCSEDYPVCKDGRCYRARESMDTEGKLAVRSVWMGAD